MAEARHQFETRRRLVVAALSAAAHLGFLSILFSAQAVPPIPVEPAPIPVQLVTPPRPPDVPAPLAPDPTPAPPRPSPVKPPPPRHMARPTPAPPDVVPVPASEEPTQDGDANAEVSDAELAGAATAGSGSGGRGCDMTRWLQSALRKDRLVQAAVAGAHRGKALRVWDGDWVRHPGQEGNGLAAVREAIMWEVAFAPVACRSEPVQGLVLISLNDGPGSARLVVGSGRWRWSDLLLSHSGRR